MQPMHLDVGWVLCMKECDAWREEGMKVSYAATNRP
jgi:hypothetical protein